MYDISSGYQQVFAFWRDSFIAIINMMDNIIIFPGISVLDINIAIIIFGLIFTVVFATIKSGVPNSIGRRVSSRIDKERNNDNE